MGMDYFVDSSELVFDWRKDVVDVGPFPRVG
jgi:hypothetical protein